MLRLLGLQTSKSCKTSWLSASLDDTLRRLFHLSALITKSSVRDKFARAVLKCRLQMYEPYDIRHVHEKIMYAGGRAGTCLIERLGKANTSRRQFIAYSRNHASDLSYPHQEDTTQPETGLKTQGDASHGRSIGQSAIPSERTKGSAAPTKATTIGHVDPDAFDYGLDDARSCTTVATSVVDGKAFTGLKVPDLLQYTKLGEHFVCPLCQTVQHFNGQTAWR